jgi:hypothetical protein
LHAQWALARSEPRNGAANDDSGSRRRLAPVAQRTERLAADGADRSAHTVDIRLRATAGGCITAFHLFAIGLLLAIIGSMVIISNSPTALVLMSVALVANIAVFFLRLYYPVPFHLHILAGAWLIIACTLGIVVTQAVFRGGRVTYHRIIGAILLYLLIAVAFATLFAFVGLSDPGAIKGITFDDDRSLASALFYMSFVTLTSTGYGDIIPVHPLARSLCNIESVIGQLYPATLLARLVTLEMRDPGQ